MKKFVFTLAYPFLSVFTSIRQVLLALLCVFYSLFLSRSNMSFLVFPWRSSLLWGLGYFREKWCFRCNDLNLSRVQNLKVKSFLEKTFSVSGGQQICPSLILCSFVRLARYLSHFYVSQDKTFTIPFVIDLSGFSLRCLSWSPDLWPLYSHRIEGV